MLNFELHIPTYIIFGAGEIQRAGGFASRLGKKALIVIGQGSVKKYGYYDKVCQSLKENGLEYVTFEGIEPNPRSTTVDKAGEMAKAENVDFLIGLGGGSVMDATKAIAAKAKSEHPIWDHILGKDGGRPLPVKDALPTMMIPTVAATSSETDAGGVITNWETHEKCPLINMLLFPKYSIIDPELTVTVDPETTADGGVDIISHVLESYISGDHHATIQDRMSEGIIRTVMEYVPKAMEKPDDITARKNISWCSSLALSGFMNSGRGGSMPIHLLEHAVSGHYDIPHGRGLALLIPPVMRYTGKVVPERLETLGKNLFFKENLSAEDSVKLFENWLDSIGRKLTFTKLEIDDSKFETMAEDVIRNYGGKEQEIKNPRPITKKDIIDIFRSVL
ncbi:MAG: iron-containing alcohol dehydrogenase [candidate division Zixibacteria bacterium]|nr:iron-containing alcohol dehydrogenase [candidate division Zixibacteria bacterium]